MKTTQSPNVLALQNVVFPALRLQVNGLRRFARVRGWRLECVRLDFRVDLAVELIRRRACTGLRASDVACKMGCSRRLAEMRFREITGTSMQEAIRDARLQNARSMLEHTALPVSVVAKRSGWKSIPTFGRDFYAAMGVSPTECRKMFCAK